MFLTYTSLNWSFLYDKIAGSQVQLFFMMLVLLMVPVLIVLYYSLAASRNSYVGGKVGVIEGTSKIREPDPSVQGHNGTSEPLEQMLLKDPGASYWLKASINHTKGRDPVDALRDASLLQEVLKMRVQESSSVGPVDGGTGGEA